MVSAKTVAHFRVFVKCFGRKNRKFYGRFRDHTERRKGKYYRKSEMKVEFWRRDSAGKQGLVSFREDKLKRGDSMEKLIELNYCNQKLFGVSVIADNMNANIVVVFVHGVPGDRVDARRINVRLARRLEKIGISSIRLDFFASGISEGNYANVTNEKILEQIDILVKYVGEEISGKVKIIFIAFSEAVSSVLNYMAINVGKEYDLFACNGMIVDSDQEQYMEIRRAERVCNEFVIDSGYGVWLNTKLLRRENIFCLDKILKENKIYAFFGTEDVLSSSSMKFCEKAGCDMIYIKGADHLFTKVSWENILFDKIIYEMIKNYL